MKTMWLLFFMDLVTLSWVFHCSDYTTNNGMDPDGALYKISELLSTKCPKQKGYAIYNGLCAAEMLKCDCIKHGDGLQEALDWVSNHLGLNKCNEKDKKNTEYVISDNETEWLDAYTTSKR